MKRIIIPIFLILFSCKYFKKIENPEMTLNNIEKNNILANTKWEHINPDGCVYLLDFYENDTVVDYSCDQEKHFGIYKLNSDTVFIESVKEKIMLIVTEDKLLSLNKESFSYYRRQ